MDEKKALTTANFVILTPPTPPSLTLVRLANEGVTESITGVICVKAQATLAMASPTDTAAIIYRDSPTVSPGPLPNGTTAGEVGSFSEGGILYNCRFIGGSVVPNAKGGHSDANPNKNNYLVVWCKFAGDDDWHPSSPIQFYGRKSDFTSCEAPNVV